jgi:hypothetical protein
MPRVGFEPTIPMAKTLRVLDRAASVAFISENLNFQFISLLCRYIFVDKVFLFTAAKVYPMRNSTRGWLV